VLYSKLQWQELERSDLDKRIAETRMKYHAVLALIEDDE
jgi:hypothetical protein